MTSRPETATSRLERPFCFFVSLCAIAVAVDLAVFSTSARADALALEMSGSCAGDLRKEVMTSLGRPLNETDQVAASVSIEPSGAGFRVAVSIAREGARSRRVLSATDCAAAMHAAGLVIAIAIDPEAALRAEPSDLEESESEQAPSDTEPAPEITPDETATPVESAPEEPASPPFSSGPRWFVAGDGIVDTGTLPGWNGGGALAFGMNFDLFRAEISASLLAASQARPNAPGARVDLWFTTATASAGLAWTFESWLRLTATAGIEAGAMIGTGAGTRVLNATTAAAPQIALDATVGAEVFVIGPLFVRAKISVGAPVLGGAFQINGLGTVYAPSDFFVRGFLGVGLDLP